jgi:hypothetical protein
LSTLFAFQPKHGAAWNSLPTQTGGKARMDLLTTDYLDHASIEFTTGCNIHCIYCQSNGQGYVRQDLDLSNFEAVADFFLSMGVPRLSVFGHGETTSFKGWERCCDALLDRGLEMTLTTNLAKKFSNTEIETLSRFSKITVSVDTADRELFRTLRRGADLDRILETMDSIRAVAQGRGAAPPEFGFNSVVSNLVAGDLPSLVALGVRQGVASFSFVNMAKYDIPDMGVGILPLFWLETPQLLKALKGLSLAVNLARLHGCGVHIQPRLMEVAERRAAPSIARPANAEWDLGSKIPGPGMTRFCLDPWASLTIKASGEVWTCCRPHRLGRLYGGNTLAEIINGEPYRTLRRRWLSGDLSPMCRDCPDKPVGSVGDLRQALVTYKSMCRSKATMPRADTTPAHPAA